MFEMVVEFFDGEDDVGQWCVECCCDVGCVIGQQEV